MLSARIFMQVLGRRASYQYGTMLETSGNRALAIGIGMGGSQGQHKLYFSHTEITQTGEKHTIDGVEIEPVYPGTEKHQLEDELWIGSKNAVDG